MICLRCGYCCQHSAVIVVDDPDKGIHEDNLIAVGIGGPEKCKHLDGDTPGQFSCRIHNKSWYQETPCFKHGQIEKSNSPCRMGEYILKGGQ